MQQFKMFVISEVRCNGGHYERRKQIANIKKMLLPRFRHNFVRYKHSLQ